MLRQADFSQTELNLDFVDQGGEYQFLGEQGFLVHFLVTAKINDEFPVVRGQRDH